MESRLGRYQVLKHLTSGGMADVLLGRAEGIEGFERHVVLKRIRSEHARDQRFIRMFLDEARVAASLHHQHIVQVYDIGESEGDYFIAMEYLHGEDVRSILSKAAKSRAHVPLGYAIAIVSAAAAGLHYAHERRGLDKRPLGIVHRDISPSNILVGYDGSIKVVDFGIAKASMRQETRWSTLKGKVSYMSPEQCKGVEVDRRSDVYSLGVVLYELCTTTRLFKGESDYLVMDQIVNGRVTLPQVRRPDLPNELSAIIMRAISVDPERRYFTAEELRIALDRFAAKAGLTASTSGIAAYMRKQFGERPEPWLELEDQTGDSFDDVPVSIAGTLPSGSWTELQNSDEYNPRSTGSLPRHSGQIPILGNVAPDITGTRRLPTVVPPSTQPITASTTASKMAWESQQPASSMLRALTPMRIAMFGAPVVAILGAVLIWQLTASSDAPAPAAALPAPPPPTITPVAPPPPEPLPAVSAPPPETTDTTPEVSMRTPEQALARKGQTPPGKKTPKVADSVSVTMPPPGAKIETPSSPPPAPPPQQVAPSPPPAQQSPMLPVATAPATSGGVSLPPQAPPPPLTMPAQTVTPTALDANRIAGERDIIPDNLTQSEIGRAGVDKVIGAFKICIAADGGISTVSQLKSTGFPGYDAKILSTIRGQWRYRPFMVNGKAVPVCTAVRFIYSQK
jgi:serine/threonine protein kinase